MKIIKLLTFIFIFLFSFVTAQAQKKSMTSKKKDYTSHQQDSLKMADNLFNKKQYEEALPYFTGLYQLHPNDISLSYKMGICYLNKNDEHNKAIDALTQVLEKDLQATDISYYLGKAYFLNQQYNQALEYFNTYLSSKKADKEKKKDLSRLIENCNNGKKLMEDTLKVIIKNVGAPVNTDASEYGPVISSDESVLIYTYKGSKSTGGKQNAFSKSSALGNYYEDVFVSDRVDEKWSEPRSIGENINGDGHDACIALSSDGQKLFIYKNTMEDQGDIYMSELHGKEWSKPERLKGDVNDPDAWDGSITLSADEKTIYFSSERKGGFGGRDIYKASLKKNGGWGNVSNLGPNINTKYDDDAPFIHPDGKQLYFSSTGHNSMGGYDIFRVDIDTNGLWLTPINLGYPINTADDDRFYVLTSDGKKGYYSSGKENGYGKQDIYLVEPGVTAKKTVLVLLKGNITLDHQPVEANIVVSNADDNQADNGNDLNSAAYTSNAATGKYLINLPAGVHYKITYSLEGYDKQMKMIDARTITAFDEQNIDINFSTEIDGLPMAATTNVTLPVVEPQTYDDYLKQYGNDSIPDLEFFVQIAAFRIPENYHYKQLKELGVIEKKENSADGVTRFTIGGSFKTLAEANTYKNLVVDKGATDAFVYASYQGKRIAIKELIEKKLLPPK